MKPSGASSKPTLESLLRVKRAERPDEPFWQDFDRELRRKQLAATIEPKPWWLGLSLVARKLALPVGVPAGALAALTVAMVSYRTLSSHVPSDVASPSVAMLDTTPQVAVPAVENLTVAEPDSTRTKSDPVESISVGETRPESVLVAATTAPRLKSTAVATATERTTVGVVSEVDSVNALPGIGLPEIAYMPATAEPETPSQHYIAYNLAEARQTNPEMVSAYGLNYALGDIARRVRETTVATPERPEPVAAPVAVAVDDLTPRNARLLALVKSPEDQETAVVAANIAREQSSRLNDDVLYASATRLGVGGDRLSISF